MIDRSVKNGDKNPRIFLRFVSLTRLKLVVKFLLSPGDMFVVESPGQIRAKGPT